MLDSPPTINEQLDAHADCEMVMCFDCTDVWTGTEFIYAAPKDLSLDDFFDGDRTYCPRCWRNLKPEILKHMAACPLTTVTQEVSVPEPKADRFAKKIYELAAQMETMGAEAIELDDPIVRILIINSRILTMVLRELDEIRLQLKSQAGEGRGSDG